ncbi:MAG TPA: sugar ABC transporter substrate-binding protein [Anaerolineae bacterium]
MKLKNLALLSMALLMTTALALGCAAPAPQTVEKVVTSAPIEKVITSAPVEKVVEKVVTSAPVEKTVVVTSAPKARYTIGVMLNSMQHPYITAEVQSVRSECASMNLNCIELDAQFDAAKQAKQVEDLIARKVDGILFFPVDVGAVKPLLKKINDAKIPVVSYGNRVLDEDLPLVNAVAGEDSNFEGQQVARMLAKDFSDKAAKIVVIEGQAGGWVATQRSKGFEDTIKQIAPKVQILAKQPADWNRAKALKIMEDYLTRYPAIDAVYAHDDDMAMGAVEAIKAAGLTSKVKVYGIGGMGEFMKLLKTGQVAGTVMQSPVQFGTLPVRVMNDILVGRNVQKFNYIDMPMVTKDNVDQFKPEW